MGFSLQAKELRTRASTTAHVQVPQRVVFGFPLQAKELRAAVVQVLHTCKCQRAGDDSVGFSLQAQELRATASTTAHVQVPTTRDRISTASKRASCPRGSAAAHVQVPTSRRLFGISTASCKQELRTGGAQRHLSYSQCQYNILPWPPDPPMPWAIIPFARGRISS